MAIVQPNEMDFSNKNIIMIISGLPGVGKTTLALSAPKVVLIDTDEGMARVKVEHRKDASMCKTYEELLADVKAFEGKYETVVIDTGGSLIDLQKDWAMRNEPTANKKSGGFSLQGYGFVKTEFLRLSADLRKKFNVIYLFHETKEKDNEEIFYTLVCEGAARNLVWQPADLGAHLFMQDGERYLGFTPTAQYSAKSAYGIKGLVKVPELKDGDPNDFLTRLFTQVKKNLAEEKVAMEPKIDAYKKAMAYGQGLIADINGAGDVKKTLEYLKGLEHAETSKDELNALLKQRLAELHIIWNKDKKTYEQSEA